ncbi:hypothetical protein FNH05_17550 [Amycolatopsis rhizosphaerae]|uniref:Uncharacterized protein n=1 Tax=Amycolatopsis rhizosphaerae TaxID=2053003 RepID=A0A558CJB3_9PSEU|nr:hypothetical protein [Amycolatopsis rhizosphaerae]TVT48824.1 hypothetical protein FNH05_17550 [Amycolatopsis rhizosphaerae]
MNEVQAQAAQLHRPWRKLVAVAELLVAGAAVWLAFPCWQLGVRTVTVTLSDGTVLVSTRYFGNWMSAAVGLGMLAAILLVDAVREVMLGARVKRRRRNAKQEQDASNDDYVAHLNGA